MLPDRRRWLAKHSRWYTSPFPWWAVRLDSVIGHVWWTRWLPVAIVIIAMRMMRATWIIIMILWANTVSLIIHCWTRLIVITAGMLTRIGLLIGDCIRMKFRFYSLQPISLKRNYHYRISIHWHGTHGWTSFAIIAMPTIRMTGAGSMRITMITIFVRIVRAVVVPFIIIEIITRLITIVVRMWTATVQIVVIAMIRIQSLSNAWRCTTRECPSTRTGMRRMIRIHHCCYVWLNDCGLSFTNLMKNCFCGRIADSRVPYVEYCRANGNSLAHKAVKVDMIYENFLCFKLWNVGAIAFKLAYALSPLFIHAHSHSLRRARAHSFHTRVPITSPYTYF